MAHNPIRSGRDDFLVLYNFNDSGSKAILFENKKNDAKAHDNKHVGNDAHIQWNIRPVKAIIKPGDNKHENEKHIQQGCYFFLACLCFSSGYRFNPPLEELWIFFDKIHRNEDCGNSESQYIDPRLQIINCP